MHTGTVKISGTRTAHGQHQKATNTLYSVLGFLKTPNQSNQNSNEREREIDLISAHEKRVERATTHTIIERGVLYPFDHAKAREGSTAKPSDRVGTPRHESHQEQVNGAVSVRDL